jgi:hypothetical protein
VEICSICTYDHDTRSRVLPVLDDSGQACPPLRIKATNQPKKVFIFYQEIMEIGLIYSKVD